MNTVHPYENPGTYFPSLVVSSEHCRDTISQSVTINPIPHADFTHPFVCGLTGDFIDQSINGNYYSWNFGDGYFSGSQNPTHTYAEPGYYHVSFIITTDAGCIDSTDQQIRIYPVATADFTPLIVSCNSNVRFTNNSINGQLYSWNFGDSTSTATTGSNPIHIYQEAGNYTTTLIANPGACADTATRNFRVSISPVASFDTPDECGLTAHFLNLSRDNDINQWNFGDGFTSNEQNPEHTFYVPATFIVKLVVENEDACKDSLSRNTLIRLPAIAAFNDFTDTCEQDIKLLNASERSGNYLWDFGDGIQSSDLNATHQYYSTGFYNVMLIADPNTACADTTTKTVFAFGSKESHLYIPSAFTPNSDGKNDGFIISGYSKCLLYHLAIFNRWGEKLFETNDISRPWDGYYHGRPVEEGVYVYLLTGGGNELKGHVTVLR
jgi:gliding motility-associated-like protein